MTAEFESAVAKKTKKYNNTAENGIITFQTANFTSVFEMLKDVQKEEE